jgi:spore coat protein CotH
MISTGQKRSLNLSLEYAHKGQNVGGYRVLNLLNNSNDPTFLRVVLYSEIVRTYIPSAKANYVRAVINGESWGIYSNIQQINKDFTRDFFNSEGGARWKVPGLRMQGGLQYLGDNPSSYKSIYQIKSKDKPESWQALIALCKTLNQDPPKTLRTALAPMLDIEGALKFLALDITMVNDDGYWTRLSDYCIYLDKKGIFHILPYDTNETFSSGEEGMGGMMGGMGGGMPGGGFGGGSTSLDPLTGSDSPQLALMSKLLASPDLRARYLEIVRDIAQKWLDWERLGPVARRYHDLIAADIKSDTRKLYSTEEFESGLKTIESFAKARRTYLLSKLEISRADSSPIPSSNTR